jgi:hypothetical protein
MFLFLANVATFIAVDAADLEKNYQMLEPLGSHWWRVQGKLLHYFLPTRTVLTIHIDSRPLLVGVALLSVGRFAY